MKNKRTLLAGGLVVVIAIAAFGGWWFVFRDTSPPPVDLESAVAALEDETPAAEVADATPDANTGLDGTWTVDTTIGSFDDFTSSFIGFRIDEELVSIGGKTVVGRSPGVTGTLGLAGTTISDVTIEGDMTRLQTDNSGRDAAIRRQAIETDTFPTAGFALTAPVDIGAVPAEGDTISVEAEGDVTVHGVTRAVTVPIEAQLVDDVIVVTGSLELRLEDFDITKPSAAAVVSVEDTAFMEFQLFFVK